MKKIVSIFLLASLFAAGCSPTPVQEDALLQLASGQKSEIVLDSDGDLVNIRFTSTHDWQVELSESPSWLEVTPLEGAAGKGTIKVSAEANTTGTARMAEVLIRSYDLELKLTFTQENFVSLFEILETEGEVSACGGLVVIPVNTTQDFTYESYEDWLIPVTTSLRKAKEVILAAEPNVAAEARSAEVVFTSEGIDYVFTLTQTAAGPDLQNWESADFAQRSLAMRFTADWCGYCPYMATAFDSAKDQMGGALELVSLHGEDSSYEFSGTNELIRRFDVDGFPTGIVDARASIPNYQSTATTADAAMQVAQETQDSYPASTGISCSSHVNGTNLTVSVSLYFKEADSYHVTVLLLEDGIVGKQSGAGSNYTHNDVARYALTSMSGESIRVAADNTILTKTYAALVDSKWNPDNLKVLVYVERSYDGQDRVEEVKAADYGNYGDTYIETCLVAEVGETAELQYK